MPHMVAMLRLANRMLDAEDRSPSAALRDALDGSTTLVELAERIGLLDGAADAGDAKAALSALPSSVAAAVLAVVRDAAERDVPVVLQWKPGVAAEVQVWEDVEDGVGQIGLLLVTPRGRELAGQSTIA